MKKTIYLPDFIIIGANKAGTTSIADYLNQNPEIKISDVKEPMFFSSTPMTITSIRKDASLANPYHAVTLDEYSNMFKSYRKETKIFGEASTAYLANPYASVIMMKKLVPDVKIIAILREPVSRAVSAYKMCLGQGIEDKTFHEIVMESDTKKTILKGGHGVKEYIRNGLYSQLLELYLEFFDRSQILILDYDELKKHPNIFMDEISKFIGVKYFPVDFNKKLNVESDHVKEEVEINSEDLKLLKEHFREDLVKLQQIVDFDLTEWIK